MTKKTREPPLKKSDDAFVDRLLEKEPDAATLTSVQERLMPAFGRASMHKLNSRKRISQEVRDKVTKSYEELRPTFPSNSSCYEAVAIILEIEPRRVRTIIDQQYRKKS